MTTLDNATLDRLVAFRHELHQNPEISMKEFETKKRIIGILKEFGVQDEWILPEYPSVKTALVVDIKGQGQPEGKNFCVALRADTDALSMNEESENIPYKSQNPGAAHMCGHDGHVTCLISLVPLLLKNIKQIPSNKTVRLLFQPSEEGPLSGAEFMIKQGCLEGVDEVYGFHNWPAGNLGDIWCKAGPVMSQITIINILIIGTGGHGSEPEKLKVAVWKAIEIYQQFQHFLTKLKEETKANFVCTLPVLQAGERYNVISQSARISGTLRCFDVDIRNKVHDELKRLSEKAVADGFTCNLDFDTKCLTANTEAEAGHVERVARKYLPEPNVFSNGTLPFRASEDFGEYTKVKPGAFFFFCTKESENDVFLHNPRFNFKDSVIPKAASFWYHLVMDRVLSK